MPTISVIVPVYKVEKYLHRCVDSILSQTFTDFELILVDDGSPDRCGEMCDDYAKKDSRIRVIHQENQGQAVARNNGVSIAECEWISFVDSDDFIHPLLLECLYQGVLQNKVLFSALKTKRVDESCNSIEETIVPGEYVTYSADSDEVFCELVKMPVVYWLPCCKLIHRSVVLRHSFPTDRIYEDNATVYKWIFTAGKIAVCQSEMYYYRRNIQGTNLSEFSHRKTDYLTALEEQINFYTKQRFFQMVQIIGDDYLQISADYYEKAVNILKDHKKACEIRRNAERNFFRINRYVSLSIDQLTYVAKRLESKKMKVWLFLKRVKNRLFN